MKLFMVCQILVNDSDWKQRTGRSTQCSPQSFAAAVDCAIRSLLLVSVALRASVTVTCNSHNTQYKSLCWELYRYSLGGATSRRCHRRFQCHRHHRHRHHHHHSINFYGVLPIGTTISINVASCRLYGSRSISELTPGWYKSTISPERAAIALPKPAGPAVYFRDIQHCSQIPA